MTYLIFYRKRYKAYNTLINLSADEQKRLEYEAREKALKDYNTQMSSAEKRGYKKGCETARQVFQLYMQGKTSEQISEICNIPLKKVIEILD